MKFFKRATQLVLVAALAGSMAVPANAADKAEASKAKARKRGTSCGGKWDAGGVCNFRYAGGALSISGSFRADLVGFVNVTLEAVDSQTGQRVPLINCGVAGSNFGGCASVATDSPTIELERGQRLFCTVQGADIGRYKCSSSRT